MSPVFVPRVTHVTCLTHTKTTHTSAVLLLRVDNPALRHYDHIHTLEHLCDLQHTVEWRCQIDYDQLIQAIHFTI